MNPWTVLGFFGQFLFSMRFLMQWIASERKKESTIPIVFWYLSISGSLVLLLYALHIKNPVFILGQSVGCIIYLRNLILIHRKGKAFA